MAEILTTITSDTSVLKEFQETIISDVLLTKETIGSGAVVYKHVPYNFALSPGQYVHPLYTTSYSRATAWTFLGNTAINAPITVQAVEWSIPRLPANLYLRDSTGQIFFTAVSGSCPHHLTTPVTVKAPIEYYDTRGGNKIAIIGRFG